MADVAIPMSNEDWTNEEWLQKLIESEPPRQEGKHRFMAGTCVDCGRPFDPICTANLQLEQKDTRKGNAQ